MTPLRDLLESIITLTKIWKRDQALKPIETKLARKMATAFRAHRAVFMREFERVGPGILGEASAPPAIEGALEAAYQATLADFLAPIEEAAGPRSPPPRSIGSLSSGSTLRSTSRTPERSPPSKHRRPRPSRRSTRQPGTTSPVS